MYTSFYKLHTKPFQISSDPDFMWFGEKHKEAFATLKYGVLDNKGFLLLTGDVGTGKTTLINALIQSLSNDIIYACVSDPSLSKLDFFNYIAASFGIDKEFLSKGSFLVGFRRFLLNSYEKNKKVVLIVDESQLLTQELLEEIRLLSNIEKSNSKLINIFFVGQNEFNEILNQDQNRAVRQRLTLNYNIDPLTPDETQQYIKYRLKVAGAKRSIFDASAFQEVFMYSGGFPRRINIICDHALLSGYVNDKETITAAIVDECAKELKIPAYVQNRDIDGFGNSHSNHVPIVKANPVVLKPRKLEKKKHQAWNILMLMVAAGLFAFIAWWVLSPVNFQQFLSNTYNKIEVLKNGLNKSVPETSYLPRTSIEQNKIIEGSERAKKINIQDQKQIDNQSLNLDEMEKKVDTSDTLAQNGIGEEQNYKKLSEYIIESPKPIVAPLKPTTQIEKKSNPSNVNRTPVLNPVLKKIILPLPEDTLIIRFSYNSNNFTDEGFNKLQDFAKIIMMHPGAMMLISGYTDSNGNKQYNIKLSEFRANIVKSFLLGKGVSANQIQVKGLGSLKPIASNDTLSGRNKNRRVEIEIVR